MALTKRLAATLGWSVEEVAELSALNLKDHTPPVPTRGEVSAYASRGMPYDLNLVQAGPDGGRFIAATFSDLDVHQSARVMIPGITGAMCALLGCREAQAVFAVTYSRCDKVPTPLFAALTSDMPAILRILKLVQTENERILASDPNLVGEGLECRPFTVNFDENLGVRIWPYPALAQQHATRCGRQTFMPWPGTDKQHQALTAHNDPLILQAQALPARAAAPRCLFPLRPEAACFQCGTREVGGRAVQLKCGKCRHALYCNAACQRANWALHKPFCKMNRLLFGREEQSFNREELLANLNG